MMKSVNCCLCSKRTRRNTRRNVPNGEFKHHVKSILSREIKSTDVVCGACRSRFYNSLAKAELTTSNTNNIRVDPECEPPETSINKVASPKSIQLGIPATPRTHKYCIICKKAASNRNHLITIPEKARTQAFLETGIFIDSKNRSCKGHVFMSYFNKVSLNLLQTSKQSDSYSRTDITNLTSSIRQMMKTTSYLNFDIPSLIEDDDYTSLLGVSKEHFTILADSMNLIRNSSSRSVRTCLAVFLMKLKTGLPNKVLSILFRLKRHHVQRIIHSARHSLITEFVPKHLGFEHISHAEFCQKHTTTFARTLFTNDDSQAVVVLDGTYIYIQKSSNYKFQRRSYSMHKHRPLVKPMVIVASDGYILSVLGPYFSDYHNNDAAITKHLFKNNLENVNQWFQTDDVCIVDRGFRDAVEYLEDQGYNVKMPFYLGKGKKQHTTEEANKSRLITKVRWVVESANGRIKQWRFLDKVVPNKLVKYIGDFVKIVCAIINCFRPQTLSIDASSNEIANEMLRKANMDNELKIYLEQNNLITKRSNYSPIECADLTDFPELSIDELREITMGVYQIKQAPCYTNEHLTEDGLYELLLFKEAIGIIKVKIQSRHSKNVTHILWIQYVKGPVRPIIGWYCTCKIGSRVVGCCAHIASVLWFLGYDRHQNNTIRSNVRNHQLLDALDVPSDNDDTDSDCDSDEEFTEE